MSNYIPKKGEVLLIKGRLRRVVSIDYKLRKPMFAIAYTFPEKVWMEDIGDESGIIYGYLFVMYEWQQALVDATYIVHQAKAINYGY